MAQKVEQNNLAVVIPKNANHNKLALSYPPHNQHFPHNQKHHGYLKRQPCIGCTITTPAHRFILRDEILVDGLGFGFDNGTAVAGAGPGQGANILLVWNGGGEWCCILSLSLRLRLRFWCWLGVSTLYRCGWFVVRCETYPGLSVGMSYSLLFQGQCPYPYPCLI